MNILVAGDFCPQHRVAKLFDEGKFADVLGEVKPIVEQADYAIVNFECPVTNGEQHPIEKCGPNHTCSVAGVKAAKWVGFNAVTLANNHFRDFGDDGIKLTLNACKENGLDVVGGGMNLDSASQILFKKLNGNTLAIINVCEHEFSIADENHAGSNPLNPIKQYYDIKEARQHADIVLVIVHGGIEYCQYPSLRMKETYRFFVDAGADAVVNHHQHCYSGYEIYKGKPIFYGLGNFCFDKPIRMRDVWYEGYMVCIDFTDLSCISIKTLPYRQCDSDAKVIMNDEYQTKKFERQLAKINNIIADDMRLAEEMEKHTSSKELDYKFMFSPWSRRYTIAAYNRGILPNVTSRKKLLLFLNYLVCDSHRENLIRILRKILLN